MNIELGGYTVRDLNIWDGFAAFRLTSDPAVMRYMGFRQHDFPHQATALIERYTDAPGRWLAVASKDDPADVLGILGFEVQRHQATLSLMFRSDWKARGAGRRVGVPFVQWIFTHPQIWRVWSYVHVDNKAGQHVTEKTGALCEGRLRRFEVFPNISDEPQDVYVYSIVRN